MPVDMPFIGPDEGGSYAPCSTVRSKIPQHCIGTAAASLPAAGKFLIPGQGTGEYPVIERSTFYELTAVGIDIKLI